MVKRILHILFFLLSVVYTWGKTYENNGLSFTVPSGWEVNDEIVESYVYTISLENKNASDMMWIMYSAIMSDMTDADMIEFLISSIEEQYNKIFTLKVLATKEIEDVSNAHFAGQSAVEKTITYNFFGESLRFHALTFVLNNIRFGAFYVTENSKDSREAFDLISKSFKFSPNSTPQYSKNNSGEIFCNQGNFSFKVPHDLKPIELDYPVLYSYTNQNMLVSINALHDMDYTGMKWSEAYRKLFEDFDKSDSKILVSSNICKIGKNKFCKNVLYQNIEGTPAYCIAYRFFSGSSLGVFVFVCKADWYKKNPKYCDNFVKSIKIR